MTIPYEEYEKLKEKNEELRKQISDLFIKNNELFMKNENLELMVQNMQRVIFGTKREYTPQKEQIESSTQISLFEENENVDKQIQEEIKEKTKEITANKKKKNKTQKAGIKRAALKDVETQIIDIKLNPEETCPNCEGKLKQIGKKVVRQEIKYVPAKLQLINYVQYTYMCKECEKENNTFVKSKIPKALLAHSFVSPSLATEVMYQKYYLGVPLYRQEKMWDDKGLVLPRNMMANWNIKLSQYYLEPLYKLMLKEIKSECNLIHCDETKLQCNKEPGRKAHSNSYMWVIASGEQEKKKGIVFTYAQSRSAQTAEKLLKDFKGILVTDAYSSYNNVDCSKQANCFAHARRYFYESVPLDSNKKMITTAYGYTGVKHCDKLFEIEREIAKLSVEEKIKVRQEKSKPILDAFFEWVTETLETKIVTNNKLMKALTYAKNQRKELSEFLTDGRIPLTNSLAERAIRPFAVHRKNWLFADSVEGAKASGVMYSIVESAKANKLNIYKYINYLLEEIPQLENPSDEKIISKYLPWSEELPADIRNYNETYEDLKVEDERPSKLIV